MSVFESVYLLGARNRYIEKSAASPVKLSQPIVAPSPQSRMLEHFYEGASGTAGKAAVGVGLAGALYGAHRLRRAINQVGAYKVMKEHAGDEFHSLDDKQKLQAKKYFDAIAKHSPTVAADPIAAWNHVAHFIKHPTSYQPSTIEALRKVEGAGRSFTDFKI